jgi:uncharacterized protein (DUF427 family)
VRVTVAWRIVAESARVLRLEKKGYPPVHYSPRKDADVSLLVRTKHYTYCPYKGDCTYYSIPIGGVKSEYAVWTYEKPYEAVAEIKEYLAFYPSRADAIEVISLRLICGGDGKLLLHLQDFLRCMFPEETLHIRRKFEQKIANRIRTEGTAKAIYGVPEISVMSWVVGVL